MGRQWYSGLALGQVNLGSWVRLPNIRWPLFIIWYYRRVAKDYPSCCQKRLSDELSDITFFSIIADHSKIKGVK